MTDLAVLIKEFDSVGIIIDPNKLRQTLGCTLRDINKAFSLMVIDWSCDQGLGVV